MRKNMRVSDKEFLRLKARFENYFQSVPMQLWFAGRRDAPTPAKQLYAVQKMFSIDCSSFGGDISSERDARTGSLYSRELNVALSRLEQWERRQEVLERRKKLLIRT